ncbi:hypothetical protein HanXRQr2_Chr09g0390991 [Helianthus annuus]|uniref:Uncharacterized protein n=1 Tax=Helianthus annuus TaxID=4232 RepID=A0A9K3I6S3_HELAN|nr:hypothetical protein HanXRQr2_Chr09g0390991 [Helianthus annuus]KAJ0893381.1 hypothetical protein HanPSC8_Chr09g0376961 [Helianthus annuus]
MNDDFCIKVLHTSFKTAISGTHSIHNGDSSTHFIHNGGRTLFCNPNRLGCKGTCNFKAQKHVI